MLTPLLLRACVTGSLSVINIAGYYKQYVRMYSVHTYGFPQGLCTVRTVYICTVCGALYRQLCTYVCMCACPSVCMAHFPVVWQANGAHLFRNGASAVTHGPKYSSYTFMLNNCRWIRACMHNGLAFTFHKIIYIRIYTCLGQGCSVRIWV